jgi:hypothetical protein
VASATDFDTISFDPALSGKTITLTSGEIPLDKILVVDGSGLDRGVQLSGNHGSRIFNVASGNDVSLRMLTIINGSGTPGGAIYSAGGSTLTITACTFTGNAAQEGGAILNDGQLLLVESTLAGNIASYGGALQCRGPATIRHCTISGNTAAFGGGGIFNKTTTLILQNSIVAGNGPALDGRDIYSQLASIVYVGGSVVPSVFEDRPASPDAGSVPITNDPQLAPLADYGGPTFTMPPRSGSPAIDAGVSALSEIQQVAVTYIDPGSFTLSFNGQTTGSLPFNPSAADVQNALNGLSAISGVGGSVEVTRTANVYTITFFGALAGANQSQLVATPDPDVEIAVNTLADGASVGATDQRGPGFARVVGSAPDAGAVEVQATPLAGLYRGLFQQSDAIRQETSGSFTATLTTSSKAPANPRFSAKIGLAGKTYGFSGRFDATGRSSNSIPRRGLSPLTVYLFPSLNNRLWGHVIDGDWTATLAADRAAFNARTNPATLAGKYTFHIPGGTNAATSPQGQGFGTAIVSSNGIVTLKGTLADGRPVSQTTALSQTLQWPLYAVGSGGKSSILGWVTFLGGSSSHPFSGRIKWTKKPVAGSKLYPAGFTNNTTIFGSQYLPPPPNTQIISGSNWTGTFEGGDFGTTGHTFTLDANNKLSGPPDAGFTLKFVPATGLFSGKIDALGVGKATFKGCVSQRESACFGYSIENNQSCSVRLSPD